MRIEVVVVAGVAALSLAACSGSTGPANTGRLSLQLSSAGQAASAAPAAAADELIITDVQVVARKIRLERAPGTCPADSTAQATSGEGEQEEHTSECADVRLDPMVLEPPVDSSAHTLISVDLPEGTYREVKVQIHKLTDAPADSALQAANPGLSNLSVVVAGSFNGTDFTFTSALTSEAEIELPTPIEVTAAQPAAVTLAIDVGSWFRGASGEILNPIDPSQQIRSWIEQNIRRSFHAFEDQDHDGHPDH
jgi:hypothetical protein